MQLPRFSTSCSKIGMEVVQNGENAFTICSGESSTECCTTANLDRKKERIAPANPRCPWIATGFGQSGRLPSHVVDNHNCLVHLIRLAYTIPNHCCSKHI